MLPHFHDASILKKSENKASLLPTYIKGVCKIAIEVLSKSVYLTFS